MIRSEHMIHQAPSNKPQCHVTPVHVNFVTDPPNNPELEAAAKQYSAIWQEIGQTTIAALEEVSGLQLKSRSLEAIVHEEMSFSVPLKLRASNGEFLKYAVFGHEFGHRIIDENGIKAPFVEGRKIVSVHKVLNLILPETWEKVFGPSKVPIFIELEKSSFGADYKEAWDWAQSYSLSERRAMWEKIRSGRVMELASVLT